VRPLLQSVAATIVAIVVQMFVHCYLGAVCLEEEDLKSGLQDRYIQDFARRFTNNESYSI